MGRVSGFVPGAIIFKHYLSYLVDLPEILEFVRDGEKVPPSGWSPKRCARFPSIDLDAL